MPTRTPRYVAARRGSTLNEAMPSIANAIILRSGYFVEPATRAARSYSTAVWRKPADAGARLLRGHLAEELERAILRAVVDEDDVVIDADRAAERREPFREARKHLFLVVDRHDERDFGPRHRFSLLFTLFPCGA